MPRVETIIRRRDMVNVGQDIVKRYFPIEADVKLYGTKRPDVAKFVYSIVGSDINEGDEISYIQDIADVTYLAGIWNFELSALDERGLNFDGQDLPEGRFTYITNNLVRSNGSYALTFTDTASIPVIIPNSITLNQWCDFSDQFDVYVWCTPSATTGNRIVFSKFNGTDGFEIGFTGESNADQECFIRYKKGNGAPQTASGIQPYRATMPLLLRCWKKFGKLNVSINGLQEISIDHTETLVSNEDLKFGGGNNPAESFRGELHQVRIYGGATLSPSDAEIVYASKITPTTMKFAGTIINTNDVKVKKTVHCRSWGNILYAKQLVENLYISEEAGRTGNVYDSVANIRPIIEDMVSKIDSTIKVKTIEPIVANVAQLPTIKAVGRLSNLLQIILPFFYLSFRVTARKLLIIENPTSNDSSYVFSHSASSGYKYHIVESESRNLKSVSDILLIGYDGMEGFQRGVDRNKALILSLPFVTGADFLSVLSSRIKTRLNNEVTRYVIKSPVLTNHIRVLHDVSIQAIDGENRGEIIVAEINYLYPAGKTIINVGANVIDYFDYQTELENQIVTSSVSLSEGPILPANNIPSVSITSPTNNEGHNTNQNIVFSGTAIDMEDGDISEQIVWTATGGVAIGTGSLISTTLPAGVYTVTATITDANGASSTDEKTITITAPPPPVGGAVTAVLLNSAIHLSWTPVAGATLYQIAQLGPPQILATTTDTEYNIPVNLSFADTTIQYQVDAIGPDGVTSISGSVVSITLPSAPPGPDDVDIFNNSVPAGTIVLRIRLESGETLSDVTFSNEPNGSYETLRNRISRDNDDRHVLIGLGFAVPLNDSRIFVAHRFLTPGQRYFYRVHGRNELGRSSAYLTTNQSAST